LRRSGRHNMKQLKILIGLLVAHDAPLDAEWLDHPLKARWADHRECHVGGDFLLIYRLDGNEITFIRAGSHAQLFE
jgi:mRNA interferase YafQ